MKIQEHKCKQLSEANKDSECKCNYQIVYCQPNDKYEERKVWAMVNNNDDYYSPPYINFCPFCGEDLIKRIPNKIVPIKRHHYIS